MKTTSGCAGLNSRTNMIQPENLRPFIQPLEALQRVFDHFGGRGIVIGGIAATLMGMPRLTVDIDAVLLLSIQELPELLQVAKEQGLEPRIDSADDFARRHRVLLLSHVPTGIPIDISLGMLPFEKEAVERSVKRTVEGVTFQVPTPEDLIILKAVAHRPKDLMDIQAIIENQHDLDRARIEYWVKEFAQTMELPEIWEDIAKLLN